MKTLVAVAAVVFSIVYICSDVIEWAQGGFSTGQLILTYLAEASIPLFVLGLYAVQRPRIGTLGLVGAATYAYCYIFFAGTVVYALAARTPNYAALTDRLDPWMTVHGGLMVAAGIAFGAAVIRAGALPAWTGWTLIAGVVLVAAAATTTDAARAVAAAVRAAAFIAMGVTILLPGLAARRDRAGGARYAGSSVARRNAAP